MREPKWKLFWSPLPSGQREMTQLCAIRRDWEKGTDWRTWSCDMADFSKALLWENNGHLFNCHWKHHWGLPLGQVQQHKCSALPRWLRPPSQHGQHRGLQLLFHIGSKGWQTTERLTLLTLQQKAGVCLSCHSSYNCSLPQRAGHFQTDALVLCIGTTRHTARNCWHGSTSWLIQGKFSSQKLQIYLEISVDQFT